VKKTFFVFVLVIVGLTVFSSIENRPGGITLKTLREEYKLAVFNLKSEELRYREKKLDECVIAEKLSQRRREIGEAYKNATPAFLRDFIYRRNEKKYHDPLGPTFQFLRSEGKTCKEIIKSAETPDGSDLGLASFELSVYSMTYSFCEEIRVCDEIKPPVRGVKTSSPAPSPPKNLEERGPSVGGSK